jgi:hypothetical protein
MLPWKEECAIDAVKTIFLPVIDKNTARSAESLSSKSTILSMGHNTICPIRNLSAPTRRNAWQIIETQSTKRGDSFTAYPQKRRLFLIAGIFLLQGGKKPITDVEGNAGALAMYA